MNFFSICLSWKDFISPSILKEQFAGYSSLGWQLFSFRDWNISSQALLTHNLYWEICYYTELFVCLVLFCFVFLRQILAMKPRQDSNSQFSCKLRLQVCMPPWPEYMGLPLCAFMLLSCTFQYIFFVLYSCNFKDNKVWHGSFMVMSGVLNTSYTYMFTSFPRFGKLLLFHRIESLFL
jgi:hypothetical protein